MKVKKEQPDEEKKVSRFYKKWGTRIWSLLNTLEWSVVLPFISLPAPIGNKTTLDQIYFKYWQSYKSFRCSVSSCIPFTQSWHSLPPWKMVIAAGQVKQIWFHSYLVTLRFSFSWAGCNKIRLVPPGLGRNLLPSRLEMDGENPDWLWLPAGLWGAGSSAVYWRGKEGWMDRGEGQGRKDREKSISWPSVSFL